MPADRSPLAAALPWTVAIVAVGIAIALSAATFLRDRSAAVAAERQIVEQQRIIVQLSTDIDRMNRDIRSMQAGIGEMQQEIIRLRQK